MQTEESSLQVQDVHARHYADDHEMHQHFQYALPAICDFQVGYVLQNDSLLPALTVNETLYYTARLRVPETIGDDRLAMRVSPSLYSNFFVVVRAFPRLCNYSTRLLLFT